MSKLYSDEVRAAAVARYVDVGSSVEVGVEYGVTPQTIINWARARGVEVPPRREPPSTQKVTLDLPRDLHAALQQRAQLEDRSMASLIRNACRDYLDNNVPMTGGLARTTAAVMVGCTGLTASWCPEVRGDARDAR